MSELSFATFLTGAAIGLAVAMPIGPMGVLCIHRTFAFGFMGGFATGLAAATVQITYGLIAAFGAGPASLGLITTGKGPFGALCVAVLLWFGYRIFRQDLHLPVLAPSASPNLRHSYSEALAFGFANPLGLVLFFAALPALSTADDILRVPVLITGVFAGVIGWYATLSLAVAALRNRLPIRSMRLVNRAAGLVLVGLALSMIPGVFGEP